MENDTIYIDSRETKNRRDNFINYVESHPKKLIGGLKPISDKIKNGEEWYEITSLEYGDFIYNNVIIEYKTEDDLIDSSRSNGKESTRLNRQLYECNVFAPQDIVYVVLEGNIYNVQSEFVSRMSVKSGLITHPEQSLCFKDMLYVMRLQDKVVLPPTNNIRKLEFAVSMALTLGFSWKQANDLNRWNDLRDINDFIKVFNQDLDSFKKQTKVKYLNEIQFNKARRDLGL
jgi:hypothetical protein